MRRRSAYLMMVLGLFVLGGCSTCQVQLWSNSDSDDPTMDTQRNPHYGHVGETVLFRVPVQPDVASYVVMEFQGQLYMCQKVGAGDYLFSWSFDEKWRDTRVLMEARAYRQAGRPDFIVESNRVRRLETGNDPPDELLGAMRMTVQCYQSRIVARVRTPGGAEPDWSKAFFEIYGPGDKVSRVGIGRPGVDGVVALGKDSGGTFTVVFDPTVEQIHKMGKTRAVFVYPDPAGQADLRQDVWFDTP